MCGGMDAFTLPVFLGSVISRFLVWTMVTKRGSRDIRGCLTVSESTKNCHLSGRFRQSEERQDAGGAQGLSENYNKHII